MSVYRLSVQVNGVRHRVNLADQFDVEDGLLVLTRPGAVERGERARVVTGIYAPGRWDSVGWTEFQE